MDCTRRPGRGCAAYCAVPSRAARHLGRLGGVRIASARGHRYRSTDLVLREAVRDHHSGPGPAARRSTGPRYEATRVLKLLRRDEGQGLAEYALILALIAIIAIVALVFLGSQVSSLLSTVGTSV